MYETTLLSAPLFTPPRTYAPPDDFKPLSIGSQLAGKLLVGDDDEVSVSFPLEPADGGAHAQQYKGSKKPCTKECILLINTETGEASLEKISSMVQLKAVR